jgi:hypothetical protein
MELIINLKAASMIGSIMEKHPMAYLYQMERFR